MTTWFSCESRRGMITSALDAASVGVPIIASRTGGIPTYFDEDAVFFVPVGDHLAMREAALSSTVAERLAKAERARHRFNVLDYSTHGLMRRYCDMSRKLLDDRLSNTKSSPSDTGLTDRWNCERSASI